MMVQDFIGFGCFGLWIVGMVGLILFFRARRLSQERLGPQLRRRVRREPEPFDETEWMAILDEMHHDEGW